MKKNKQPNPDDDYGPEISCPVCTKCYLRADLLKWGMKVCWFNGPYKGYQYMEFMDG